MGPKVFLAQPAQNKASPTEPKTQISVGTATEKQTTVMAEEEDEAANLAAFLQWAAAELKISDSPFPPEKLSCLGHSLCVSHFPRAGGRGLAAARDLKKGELILRVPREALMTSEALMNTDPILSAFIGRHPCLSSSQILAVALLNEANKGKGSWWYPYLKQMPRSYDTLAGFAQFEIQALQVDDAIWAAERAAEKAKSEWEEVRMLMCELQLKPSLLNFKAWLWAAATISSRTMHIPWDEAGCLTPVGDFFNYAAPMEVEYDSGTMETCGNGIFMQAGNRLIDAGYEEEAASYCFYARRNYREGEQVLLSYGMYTNLELLEHYGFLLPDNPNDKVFIPLEPEMYSLCPWPKELLYIDQGGKPSFALLSVMRLWATPANKRRTIGHLAYSGEQLSSENETTIVAWIAKKCEDILNDLPTTVEEDELLLSPISKIQDNLPDLGLENAPPSCICQVQGFLQSNSYVVKAEDFTNLCISHKTRRSIARWKLAVEWRLSYKRKLAASFSQDV